MVKHPTAARPHRASPLLGSAPAPLVLKIEGTERDGQILRIHTAKCLVGSGADCQLRLIAADVLPRHCVIYRGRGGMGVKSWTRDTRVNGNTVSETWLRIGDRLSLGSLNFEVLADTADQQTAQPVNRAELTQAQRAQRRKAHRRIRGLLDVVRDQKNSFGTLQNRLDETQKLVDSLLAKETEAEPTAHDNATEKTARAQLRKRGHRRVRALLTLLRELAESKEKLHAQLREQLAEKEEEIEQIRQRLDAMSDTTQAAYQAERDQRRQWENRLQEAEATIVQLREQAAELQSRQEELRSRLLDTRQHGKNRVKSILAHLRQMRMRLGRAEEQQTAGEQQTLAQLAELRHAYQQATEQLNHSREALKATESELAWSQAELQERQQQSGELAGQIQALEQQLAAAQVQQATAEAKLQTAPTQPGGSPQQAAELRHELEEAHFRCDQLELRLAELRQQNASLQESIGQLRGSEATLHEQLEDARQATLALRRQLEEDRRLAALAGGAPAGHDLADESGENLNEEEALDHLRSMGILRETPPPRETGPSRYASPPAPNLSDEPVARPTADEVVEGAGAATSQQTPEESPEVAVNPVTGLSSFPDFEFPEDEAEKETPPAPSTATNETAPGDDDASIDDYMKSLLERMRAKQGEATVPSPQPATAVKQKPGPAPSAVVVEAEPVQPITDEEFLPSRFAPEQTSDIRKLRELANQTAKAAIDSATINRWERLCKSKLSVSVCALGAGFTLHFLSADYLSLAFAGACLAYVVTVFWWLQSAVIYKHVKTHRRARVEQRIQDEIIAPTSHPVPTGSKEED